MIFRQSSTFDRQLGLTLVELMVALVLGLLMTIAVVQTFLTTKQTYNVTNGVSRIQENARFGHHFITKDLRQAGSRDCVNQVRNMLQVHPPTDYLSFEKPISGWEYSGTSQDDTYTYAGLVTPTSGWTGDGAFPNFLVGDAIAGSDVLALRSFEKQDVTLTSSNLASNFQLATLGAHDIPGNSIVLVGNCNRMDLFQHVASGGGPQSVLRAQSGTGTPGNEDLVSNVWSKAHGTDSDVYALATTYYFIQEGANGLPSLYRVRTTESPPSEDIKEELVEGVESLQVYFGEDTTSDDNPNRYVSADLVGDWSRVVSVRIGILFHSTTNVSEFDQANEYTLLDNIKITHAVDDAILRYAVNSTVKLRNRGLSSMIANSMVCQANTVGCGALGAVGP